MRTKVFNHGDARAHFILEHADEVIRNDGTLDELKLQIADTLETYLS